jgi:hypothetical protein
VTSRAAWLVVWVLLGACRGEGGGGSESGKPARNEAVRRTLVQMGREDQAEIEESFRNPNAPPTKAPQRQAVLRQILAEHGWPGISLAGEDGATGAWLVAQHADPDVAFQRECLALLEAAYRRGDVPGKHLAYLTDRVRVNENRPQVYGTQASPSYDEATRAAVNARRKQLGLKSMEETARETGRMLEQAYRRAAAGKPAAATENPQSPP